MHTEERERERVREKKRLEEDEPKKIERNYIDRRR